MRYCIEIQETFRTLQCAEDTFDYIVDFSHIDQWDHTIVEAKKVGDLPVSVGTRFELLYAIGKKKKPISYQISELTRPSNATLKGVGKAFTTVDTVSIETLEQGCQVDWHTTIAFSGLSAVLARLIANKIKSNALQTIRELNTVLDAQADTA